MKTRYLLLFSLLISGLGFSQWTNNSTINTKVCNATGDQADARIISDGADGAIITWMDSRPAGNTDIFVQRIDSTGLPKWTANGVAICTEASDQSVPAPVEDGNGGAIIVWKDVRNGNSDIYAQKINSLGIVQWTTNGIAVDTKSGDQIEPKIESDGVNGVIITWQDSVSGNWDIYAQRINSGGSKLWSAGGVAVCTAADDQKNPRIEMNTLGEAMIVWQDKRNGLDYDIYAQKLNTNGIIQWAVNGVAVCSATDTQNNPKIESDGLDGVIIGWADKRNGNDYNVHAQRLNGSGVPQWTSNGISVCSEANNQSAIDLSSENISGAIFTWKDYRNNIYADIYAQYIDISGAVQWTVNGIPISTKPFDQLNPNIVTDSTGAIIVWQDSIVQWDVYAQKILLNGSVQWGTNGKIIGNAANSQVEPKHLSDGKGGAIVAWQDNRDTSKFDIYAQNINPDGSLGNLVGVNEWQVADERWQIYPNPTKGKIQVISNRYSVTNIEIYNVLGQRIFRLQNTDYRIPITIDLSNQPKGIYFYRILSENEILHSEKIVIE